MPSREEVYAALDSERAYQESRKSNEQGKEHSVGEFLVFMQSYLTEAQNVNSRTWGPKCDPATLAVVRKVVALGVACMEANGAPEREGFERNGTPDYIRDGRI